MCMSCGMLYCLLCYGFYAFTTPGGEGEKIRTRLAGEVLDEAFRALEKDIDIAIYDASNINKQRRSMLKDSVAASGLHAKASERDRNESGLVCLTNES